MLKTDQKLLKQFIGKNSDKILKNNGKNFNIAALFLGPGWLLYRRSYLLGFLILCVSSILIYILSVFVYANSFIIFQVIYAFLLSPLYIWDVKRKITRYKKMYKDQNILEQKVINAGGTSTIALLSWIVLIGFILTIYGINIVKTTGTYIYKTKELSFEVPKTWTQDKNKIVKNSCQISGGILQTNYNTYSSIEALLEKLYGKQEVKNREINDVIWRQSNFIFEDKNTKLIYVVYKDKGFLIISSYNKDEKDKCINEIDNILEGVKLK